ncbi:hypothetical protein [Pectinatus sottacetonis]|uniref:hypothetical protein n=1 Tax=Pectinatus sottacetonis TaxID=1002795 RepID=UPI0018C77FDE|nr:hypothetical protein [Pectinatus sottacetonis]
MNEKLKRKNAAYQNIFKTIETRKDQEKKEMRHLYKTSVLLFSALRKNIVGLDKKSTAQEIEQNKLLHTAEVVYLTYLSQLPAVIDICPLTKLVDDITAGCDNRIIIDNKIEEDIETKGNHKYIKIIFKILVHILQGKREKLRCVLSGRQEETKTAELLFNIDMQQEQISQEDENQLRAACVLLNRIAAFYDMGTAVEYAEDKLKGVRISWLLKNYHNA